MSNRKRTGKETWGLYKKTWHRKRTTGIGKAIKRQVHKRERRENRKSNDDNLS